MADKPKRERWIVTNNTNKIVSVSDLPKVPSINPGCQADILQFYNYAEASNSHVLHALLSKGWLSLTKTQSYKYAPVEPIQQDELDKKIDNLKITDLADVNGSLSGNSGKHLQVNSSETGFEIAGGQDGVELINVNSTPHNIDDEVDVILVDASNENITINLRKAANDSGRILHVKKIDSSSNSVIVEGNGSETIDGDASKYISSQYKSFTIVSDGSNWFIL